MKINTRKTLLALLGLTIAVLTSSQANAVPVTFSLLPSSQTASTGTPVSLDLTISGLTAGGPASLGDFDVDIGYDTGALFFQGYTLGASLGDIGLGEALDFSLGDLGSSINIAEQSLLDPDPSSGPSFFGPYLDDIQSDSFVLATLDFLVVDLAAGASTTVSVATVNAAGDGFGLPLAVASTQDAIIRNPSTQVPEPTVLALLAGGLISLRIFCRSTVNIRA